MSSTYVKYTWTTCHRIQYLQNRAGLEQRWLELAANCLSLAICTALISGSKLDRLVGVGARSELLGLALVDNLDGANENNALGEGHVALDGELVALDQRGRAVRYKRLELVDELVASIELHVRRHAVALGDKLHAVVWRHGVGVGHERKHVVGGLHRRETSTRDEDGLGAGEALDSGTHRGLKLEHLGGGLVTRVNGLSVLNHGKRQHAVVLLEGGLESLQVDPQVVRVEELVLADVLELFLVRIGALRGLAQQQAAGLLAH